MMHEIQGFYEQLKKDGIIFSFSGPVSQSLLEGIGQTLRQKMSLEDTSTNVTQKVFSIFVELMQNVINYSAERFDSGEEEDQEISFGVLIIGKDGDRFYIQCGNYIDPEQEAVLREQLSTIQSMDKDALKQYYKEQRRKEKAATSKGAGLGFIEMARKASEPISFQILPTPEGQPFFVVNAII